jgi:AcrR family transcriptional regulator
MDKEKAVSDHRPKMAEKKRLMMRTKLLDAAMRVFAEQRTLAPVIDDVIREAKVSRGTFYRYFTSLDQVLVALGQDLNNQMTTDILPVYDILTEPWQRFCVGYRLFLVRALLDRKWAGFVTRADAWPHQALVAEYMTKDLYSGRDQNQFVFGNIDATTDFLMGASAHAIQTIVLGTENINEYVDSSVRMALMSVGCSPQLSQNGVKFSLTYLQAWASGETGAARPVWALNMQSKEGRDFLAHTATTLG